MSENFIVYPDKTKLFISIIVCAAFISLGFCLLLIGKKEIFLIAVGSSAIIFFGLCTSFFIYKLVSNKPLLIISEKGIYENSSYISIGFIPWNEIEKVYIHEYMKQKMIGIETVDKKYVISRAKGFKRMLILMNKGLIKSQVNIPQGIFKISLEEIYKKILDTRGVK
jgi:hypothetical protein